MSSVTKEYEATCAGCGVPITLYEIKEKDLYTLHTCEQLVLRALDMPDAALYDNLREVKL